MKIFAKLTAAATFLITGCLCAQEDKEIIAQYLVNLENQSFLQSMALDALDRNEKKLDIDVLIEKLRTSLKSDQVQEKIHAAYSSLSEQDLQDIRAILENPAYQKLSAKKFEIINAMMETIQQEADEIINALGEPPSAYILELTSENFCSQVLLSSRPVVIDCSSKHCFPCLQLNPIFDALQTKYGEKIQFAKIDCDAQPELANLFRVKRLPTLLFLKPGRPFPILAKAIVGKPTHEELETALLQLVK
jgi:thioredoxin 1